MSNLILHITANKNDGCYAANYFNSCLLKKKISTIRGFIVPFISFKITWHKPSVLGITDFRWNLQRPHVTPLNKIPCWNVRHHSRVRVLIFWAMTLWYCNTHPHSVPLDRSRKNYCVALLLVRCFVSWLANKACKLVLGLHTSIKLIFGLYDFFPFCSYLWRFKHYYLSFSRRSYVINDIISQYWHKFNPCANYALYKILERTERRWVIARTIKTPGHRSTSPSALSVWSHKATGFNLQLTLHSVGYRIVF